MGNLCSRDLHAVPIDSHVLRMSPSPGEAALQCSVSGVTAARDLNSWDCMCCVTRLPPLVIPNQNPLLFLLDCFNPRSSFAASFHLTQVYNFLIKAPTSSRALFSASFTCLVHQWDSSQPASLFPAVHGCLTLLWPPICVQSPPSLHYCSPAKFILPFYTYAILI